MKKSLKKILLIGCAAASLALITYLPNTPITANVFAQGFSLRPNCDPALPPSQAGSCNVSAFLSWIRQIIQFLLIIAIPIGVAVIVWGGFVIMTSGGNPGKVENGKKIITAAVIGIIIAFGSWLIVTTVDKVLKGFF